MHFRHVKLYYLISTDDYYTEKIILPQQRATSSDLLGKNYCGEQRGVTQKTQAFLKPNYQHNGHLHEPVSRSVNTSMQQQSVDPTRMHYNQKMGAAVNTFNYVPQPQHMSPQPSVPNDQYSRNWQPSQIQTNNHAYNGNHYNHPTRSVQHKALPTKDTDLPNCKIPVNSPILWKLSQEVIEWKFLGRYLDLEEEIIDEIDYNTRPNKTRDKALKVLTEWVNSSTPTWVALGQALLDGEYVMLYEKLLELISGY